MKMFLTDETAQALVEYALIAAIFGISVYAMWGLFARAWSNRFNSVANTRSGVIGILP